MSQATPPPFLPPPPPPSSSSTAPRTGRLRKSGFAAVVLGGALVVGGAAGLGGAAAWTAIDDDAATGGHQSGGSSVTVADTGDRPAADGSVESVAAAVLPSVVKLDVTAGSAESGSGEGGSGSGVVLNRDGLILTNDHVVSLAGAVDPEDTTITASFNDGTRAKATVVGTDPLTDTALVRVSDVDGLTPITVGKSANLDVGEQVVAIGSPFGLDSTVTSGIVSALDRPVGVGQDEAGNTTAYPAIQTDAAINPGNSGGALVDMDGNLVGINASIRTAGSVDGSASGSIGLGFAIPVDEIVPIVDELEAGKPATHARLGIEVTDASAQSGAAVAEGAAVRNVSADSAADDAGLADGDVITAIDDHQITGADALVATVRAYRPGDTVTVTYQRGDEERSTELELGSDATTS
ncbi:PDZ domain-containing protein [Nocardioides sp. BGMRC 2183]|nr:PDZ domain-containing protein [Nocardioides sp. BGMRC 2183]